MIHSVSTVLPRGLDVYIVSNALGTEDYFTDLRQRYPFVTFLNETVPSKVSSQLDYMANADILMVSGSALSSLGASLNGDGILILDSDCSYYQDWALYRSQPIFSWRHFDQSHFADVVRTHQKIEERVRLLLPR